MLFISTTDTQSLRWRRKFLKENCWAIKFLWHFWHYSQERRSVLWVVLQRLLISKIQNACGSKLMFSVVDAYFMLSSTHDRDPTQTFDDVPKYLICSSFDWIYRFFVLSLRQPTTICEFLFHWKIRHFSNEIQVMKQVSCRTSALLCFLSFV